MCVVRNGGPGRGGAVERRGQQANERQGSQRGKSGELSKVITGVIGEYWTSLAGSDVMQLGVMAFPIGYPLVRRRVILYEMPPRPKVGCLSRNLDVCGSNVTP